MSEFQKDSLSLEETNKARISLGLRPLQPDSDDDGGDVREEDDDPLKNQDEKAAKNYAQYQEDLRRKKEEEKIRERIARAQNKRELSRKLRGPTLGEEEPSTSSTGDSAKDTLRWVKAAKKKAEKIAEKRRRDEAEAEELAVANAARYDSEDLQGLRVGHDADEIDLEAGGEGRVLTLRDSKILDGGEDELMDSALEAAEKDKLNAERKKGVKKYTGLDDDDFAADQVGRKKGVLSKYDNDIASNGIRPGENGFTLGGQSLSRTEREEAKKRQTEQMLNRTLLDLDYTKNVGVSDYLQEGDVGFKKPKTKKKKRAPARVRLDEDDVGTLEEQAQARSAIEDVEMAESASSSAAAQVPAARRQARSNETFIDDDDLALSLAKARRDKAKKAFKKITPEMIAKNLAAQREADEAEQLAASVGAGTEGSPDDHQEHFEGKAEDDSGLVFDETSEFVRNINDARQASPEAAARVQRRAALAADSARRQQMQSNGLTEVKDEPPSPPALGQHAMDASDLLDRATTVKEEDEDKDESDEEMYDVGEGSGGHEAGGDEEASAPEPLVSGGMASALALLRQQGLLTGVTPEQMERERKQKEYDAWLATRRFEDRVREAEMAASKAQGSAKDQATREYENRMRELEDARRAQDKFKNYSPDVDIKYSDEFGRTLNNHEAWKRLSHTFHGKMPGQKKQEKRLQRIMDEKKKEKMLAGDTPSGMTRAFAERAERSGQAHMVLGVGSKNNAPQEIGLLGPNTHRPKEKGKAKEKIRSQTDGAKSSTPSTLETGAESSITGVTSMIPRSTTTKSKAGFAPVKNATPRSDGSMAPPSQTDTQPPSKFKLAFNKRPAPESAPSAQPPAAKLLKTEGAN